jgi:hypothetical protein
VRLLTVVMLGSAALSLCVGLTHFGAKASLSALVTLLLAPVAAGTVVWLRAHRPGNGSMTGSKGTASQAVAFGLTLWRETATVVVAARAIATKP